MNINALKIYLIFYILPIIFSESIFAFSNSLSAYNSINEEQKSFDGSQLSKRIFSYYLCITSTNCFFQQKIEWIWLYEQHPDRFQLAMEYEKDGYTWNQEERLEDLIQPERMQQIKADFLKRSANSDPKSPYLLDVLADEEGVGCAACFI